MVYDLCMETAGSGQSQSMDIRNDAVEHPVHYCSHPSGVECITISKHHSFCIGNVFKYIWRSGLKGSAVEDLRKARFYLDREIEMMERV